MKSELGGINTPLNIPRIDSTEMCSPEKLFLGTKVLNLYH